MPFASSRGQAFPQHSSPPPPAISTLLRALLFLSLLHADAAFSSLAAGELEPFRPLVRTETWVERWPGPDGKIQPRKVTAEIWTAAIQAALEKHHRVHLPARAEPYYLDAPLVLKSGCSFKADATAEIRLKPGSNCCMIRNANVLGFADAPVPVDTSPDSGIHIEGGIWTTLAFDGNEHNGNLRGASSKTLPVPGTHGVILLHNVRDVSVRHITVRQSKAFAVHLANASNFTVEGVRLDRHWRDGVHVNGPASHGVIRDVSGSSHDDTVSIADRKSVV